ncbi:MAG: hypothetical protein KBD27_01650 [Candidatus Moranbacteria bacterium]|nr:hypothetical protein [Candidatus Moranbacteria bacterium]
MSEKKTEACFRYCLRCLGHGHFVIPAKGPAREEQYETFSQSDAYQQLSYMVQMGVISVSEYTSLKAEVDQSPLPVVCPPDLDDFIKEFCQSDLWMLYYSRSEEEREKEKIPENSYVDSGELALAVHEFLIRSPNHKLHLQ